MTLLDAAFLVAAYLILVAAILAPIRRHVWRDPWDLPPRERTLDLTGRRHGP